MSNPSPASGARSLGTRWLLGPPLAGLAAAALVLGGTVSAPAQPLARMTGSILHPLPDQAVRSLPYNASADNLGTTQRYELFRNTAPPGRAAYVMGSSELSSPAPQSPSRFLVKHVSDADLFLSGRGYVQSLPHALELAAVAPLLAPRRVTLIVSPQWFAPGGISSSAMKEVYSPSFYQALLDNPSVTDDTKNRITARLTDLMGPDWVRTTARTSAPSRNPLQWLGDTAHRVSLAGAALQLELASSGTLPAVFPDPPARPGQVPLAELDWDAAQKEADAMGAASSHNEFHIADTYYTTYVEPNREAAKGSLAGIDFAADSPEWGDLDLFLQVAKETGIEVMLVSVPMNGRWYDFTGYPVERRATYYDRVRKVAADHHVELADFSSEEYTDYFLYDIMHLGWKGWLDVTRACLDFGRRP